MERFIELVRKYDGFEFYQAYRDDVDHVMGGKGNTFWYTVMKNGKVKESWIAGYNGGVWSDRYIKGRGAKAAEKPAKPGTTAKKIAERAYLCQDENWVTRRTPKPTEDSHPHYHYVKGFGDKALDVSVEYGVTIGYNDLQDNDGAFHLRYLYTGSDVDMP